MASPGLSHFRGWPVQDSVFFWILAHREIWGWQEGSDTLYLANKLNIFNINCSDVQIKIDVERLMETAQGLEKIEGTMKLTLR